MCPFDGGVNSCSLQGWLQVLSSGLDIHFFGSFLKFGLVRCQFGHIVERSEKVDNRI